MKLTNRSVSAGRRPTRGAGALRRQGAGVRRGRRAAAPPHEAAGSRERIVRAAAREFAVRGFSATSVDRIAAAARLNKAMIYYHFGSKAALYGEILRDMFRAIGTRVRAVAASDQPPEAKLRQFVAAIADEADARPHFPPIWFREIADGGAHLDMSTIHDMVGVLGALRAIIAEGIAQRRFLDVNPLLVHGGIVAPLLFFFASEPVVRRVERGGVRGLASFGRDEVVGHVQRVALSMLAAGQP